MPGSEVRGLQSLHVLQGSWGFLAECNIALCSLPGELHSLYLPFSIEELCFFRKCPCESWTVNSRGTFRGVCKKIDHFPEDADYEQDTAEYLLRAVRASSVFPILSVSACPSSSPAGLSNIIGIIVYISANAGDPGQSDSKKSYSYGWSFYFGALSFIIAEMVGVIAVHMYIEKHRQIRARSHSELLKKSAFTRLPPYRYRFRRRSSSRSTEPRSRDMSPISKGFSTIPSTDISMFTLSRDPSKVTMGTLLNSERDHGFLQVHNSIPKEFKESLHNNPANRRTTPV
ncbi:voltage-dependent calcium channel gamma-3 subunit [Manacus vitellinus]|uniref:voltage-dependent calcium channel gamma-3 subunit n=1 Tax=Manacus vitellinus TaxID=328815 RepID=UPI00115E398F|nr:voltage-dependent calcium channel gamma-3 subunit [Manacus vitellinus]